MRVWGHGYVARYFDGEPERLWMKRWRCPACGAVLTVRPSTHWRRFLCPWWLILASLMQKVLQGRWLSLCGRQRQQYWGTGYLKQRQLAGGLVGIEALHEMGIIVATHSLTDRWVLSRNSCPNPSLAETGVPGGG
jgi:ribosomal protein S27AE